MHRAEYGGHARRDAFRTMMIDTPAVFSLRDFHFSPDYDGPVFLVFVIRNNRI